MMIGKRVLGENKIKGFSYKSLFVGRDYAEKCSPFFVYIFSHHKSTTIS
jgi:hypothetical protein